MNNKKAFTILELIFVIILIGILSYTIIPYFNAPKLEMAYNNFINNFIKYKSFVSNNSNYRIIPSSNNFVDEQNTKYWFKKNMEFVIESKNNQLYYYIFKDLPNKNPNLNFDKKLDNINEIFNKSGKYYIGVSKQEMNSDIYPDQNEIDKTFNLSKYGIKKVKICINNTNCKYIPDNIKDFKIIYFNNNIFLDEGKAGDAGDINILDSSRKLLNNNYILNITLINNKGQSKTVNINGNGLIIN